MVSDYTSDYGDTNRGSSYDFIGNESSRDKVIGYLVKIIFIVFVVVYFTYMFNVKSSELEKNQAIAEYIKDSKTYKGY